MSGYTILGLFCSFIVFLVLPSVVLCEEVSLKIDFLTHVFIRPTIQPSLSTNESNIFFYISASNFKCTRIVPVYIYFGWYNACREETNRRN